MKDQINLKIITLEGVVFSGEVSEIILSTDSGQITILPNHIPLISKVKEGEVVVRVGKEEKKFSVTSGVLEVRPGSQAFVLVDKAA